MDDRIMAFAFSCGLFSGKHEIIQDIPFPELVNDLLNYNPDKTMDIHQIKQNNKIIAEFMGYKMELHPTHVDVYNNRVPTYLINDEWIEPAFMKYHKSWDWQIPVWAQAFRSINLFLSTCIADNYMKIRAFRDARLNDYNLYVSQNNIVDAFKCLAITADYINKLKKAQDAQTAK